MRCEYAVDNGEKNVGTRLWILFIPTLVHEIYILNPTS